MGQPAAQPPIPRLTRIAHPPPRTLRRLAWVTSGAVIAIKLLTWSSEPAASCSAASATAPPELAAAVCEREYLRGGDPEIGVRLADAQRRSGNRAVAGAIANGLLVTAARADALWVIGMLAIADDELDTARRALEAARDLHHAEHRDLEAARDDLALAALPRALAPTAR